MDALTEGEPPESTSTDLTFDSHGRSTTPTQMRNWLRAPESARLEFKEARQNFDFEKLVRYVVALANERGGKIILGVTDKRPRKVVGTRAFAEPGRLEAGLFERLRQRVSVEEVFHETQRLLIVHVPSRAAGAVWDYAGIAWSRAGDALVPMSDSHRRLIYLEAGDFSAEICPNGTIKDLDTRAIADFRSRWAAKAGNKRLLRTSNDRILVDAELLVEGRPTYAALILLGTRAALGRHLPQTEVIFEYRSSDAPGAAQDRCEYRQGFLLFHDALWQRLNLRNDKQSWYDGFFRVEIDTFDELVTREAILNAVCHREYRLGGSIFVRQYARRLEVVSPGGFPTGITVENILREQQPRNRRLAEAVARCGLVERAGQGMDLIYERMIRQGKPGPDFSRSHEFGVFLTLDGAIAEEEFIRFLEKVVADEGINLAVHDLVVLDLVHRQRPISPSLQHRLAALAHAGLIERTRGARGGVHRYILSDELYERRIVHVRQAEYQSNRNVVLRHLRNCTPRGASLGDIRRLMPALSESAVQRLLHDLRADGRVRLSGKRRGARWHTAD